MTKNHKSRFSFRLSENTLKYLALGSMLFTNSLLMAFLVYEYTIIFQKITHLDLIRQDYEEYCSHLERFIHEYEESQENGDLASSSCMEDDFLLLNRDKEHREKNILQPSYTPEEEEKSSLSGDEIEKSVHRKKHAKKQPALRVPLPRKRYYTARTRGFAWPMDQECFWISSYYGRRSRHRFHKGIDLAAPKGTPVKAVDNGVVEYAGWAGTFGTMVLIRHEQENKGYKTRYAHLTSAKVLVGERVSKGQVIGFVGNTGRVSGKNGYHLHFEVLHRGTPINPLHIL